MLTFNGGESLCACSSPGKISLAIRWPCPLRWEVSEGFLEEVVLNCLEIAGVTQRLEQEGPQREDIFSLKKGW